MASVSTYIDVRASKRIVMEPRKVRKPFANDLDLRRIINRLGQPGNQLAGWISSPKCEISFKE